MSNCYSFNNENNKILKTFWKGTQTLLKESLTS